VSKEKLQLNKKAAGIVALAVMCSRVLGLVREVLFAGLFGAGRNMDAFFVAFKAPNLLRDLFSEGALSTAFVTVFSQKIQKEGERSAWALATKMATLTLVFMSAITVGGILLADWVIALLAPGFDAEKAALTVVLTRIMFPFILLVSLAALVMGMLNAKNIFTMPALASSFFNIGSILGGIGFGYWLDPGFGPRALLGLAMGTLLGGLLQLAVQLPSLHRAGFRWGLDFQWRDSGVRRVLGLMVPSVIAGSAVQVNVMVNSIFASFLEDGAVSWLQYAFRLMQLPLGVFGVAIATVTLPVVAKIAAEADWSHFRSTLAGAIRLAFFFTIPSALGLAVLAEPIIGLIYERGRFGGMETLRTAEALQFYALGLLGYASIKVLAPAFYAADRRWIPMLASFGAIGLNVALNYVLIFQAGLGHRGLALSTTLSATANFLVLFFVMRRQLGGFEGGALLRNLLSCGLAGAALAGVAWLGREWMSGWWEGADLLRRALGLLAVIGGSGMTYAILCWLLRVPEIMTARELLQRRLARFQRPR
jgi:putative peptidoglycan lipid II flippase